MTEISRLTPLDDYPELCRVREVATYLDASTGAVYDLVRSGVLPAVRIGRLVRISRSALAAFVAERKSAPGISSQASKYSDGAAE